MAAIKLISLRPMRLWIDGVQGLDEDCGGASGCGLEHIPLGAATVDLRLQERPRRIVAGCDQPFTLELIDGDTTYCRQIPAGRWTLAIDDLRAVFLR
jgi:hypothetical protein